jgi:Caspase domain/YARHG domain/Sel1 repeat
MRLILSGIVVTLMLVAQLSTAHAQVEQRIALVVGNSAYQHTTKLANPSRDAQLMSGTLTSLGFAVTTITDADQNTLKRTLVEFGRKLRETNAVGLFYYAGHGLQVGGRNYIIPVSANIQDETEVGIESISLDEFLATMQRPGDPVNIIILDACRNNPFPSTSRSTGGGLARSDAPRGTYLAYATSPGAVASDGTSDNSPYTAALARAMQIPGLPIEEVFKQTRRDVLTETKGGQTPWESSSITGNFAFKRVPEMSIAPKVATDRAVELLFWNSIQNATTPAAFEAYLTQFPQGSFATLARIKVAELTPKQVIALAPDSAATNVIRQVRPQILPHSANRDLTGGDTDRLGCDELWAARNEMFHRHGYCFDTPRAKAWFGNDGCKTTKQDVLTPTERTNFRLIRALEIRKQCDAAAISSSVATPPADNSQNSATPAGRDCDRLAGASWDSDLTQVGGVAFSALDAASAAAACTAAIADNPSQRRYLFQLGRAHDKTRNFNDAKLAYQKAASFGSAAAMINLGILFEKGQGVARNLQEARGYYEKAARLGNSKGAFCYATALDNGLGGPAEPAKAIEWYTHSASLGHATAGTIARRLQTSPQPTGTRCD